MEPVIRKNKNVVTNWSYGLGKYIYIVSRNEFLKYNQTNFFMLNHSVADIFLMGFSLF